MVRVTLPNKEAIEVSITKDTPLTEFFSNVCMQHQYDPRDYLMVHGPTNRQVNLGTTYGQSGDLSNDYVIRRVRKKSFLIPASSKDTQVRTGEDVEIEVPPKIEEVPVVPKILINSMNSMSSPSLDTERKKRSRAVSVNVRPVIQRTKPIPDFQSDSPLKIDTSPETLNRNESSPSIVQRASTSDELLSPSSPMNEKGMKSKLSAEDISREKILLHRQDSISKTMTLQKKKLRPRASTTVDKTQPIIQIEEEIFLRCNLPGGNQTMIKVSPTKTMEEILKIVCEKKNLEFEDHTMNLPNIDAVDLDRPLNFYKYKEIPFVYITPSKEKSYSTLFLSEADRDVLILSFVKGKLEVMAATEEKLIERVTDEQETDKKFMDTVLLTFRSFMSPREFLENLVIRFNSEPPENPTEDEANYYIKWIDPVRKKVLFVLQTWVNSYWHDFALDSELLEEFKDFVSQVSNLDDFSYIADEITFAVERQVHRYEGIFNQIRKPIPTEFTEGLMLQYKSKQIAEQLCLLNYEFFTNINGIEYLNQIWKKGEGDQLECPNLLYFIERFNRESSWVATEICLADPQKRERMLKKFIHVARECFEKNNLFSMYSILSGLNLKPVQKLKEAWKALPSSTKKYHEELEKLCDPSKNMKAYRDHLAKLSPPVLPFLPMFLKDLIFFNDGNPSRQNNLVNFDKLRMMATHVFRVTELAKDPYTFEAIPELKTYLDYPRIENPDKILEMMVKEKEKEKEKEKHEQS